MSVVFLLQTRPGFERDAQQEARTVALERRGLELKPVETGEGFVLLQSDAPLTPFGWRDLAFSRTLSRVIADIPLGDRDRLTPILDVVGQKAMTFASVWLEWPDTNDGKAMSGFARKFQPLLEEKLAAAGRLGQDASTRLQLFSRQNPGYWYRSANRSGERRGHWESCACACLPMRPAAPRSNLPKRSRCSWVSRASRTSSSPA